MILRALLLKLSQRSTWPDVETWGKCTKTTISNNPCEFIYRCRHTLDMLLSTHSHIIQNVVYATNCYFKFDKKTWDHHFQWVAGFGENRWQVKEINWLQWLEEWVPFFYVHGKWTWVAVVTPTDRPKSVRNRCVIELFMAFFVLSLSAGVGAFILS